MTNDVTYEVIHSSVLEQVHLVPNLQETINNNPNLVVPLLPWEEQVKAHWERKLAQAPQGAVETAERIQENESHHHHHASLFHKAAEAVKHLKGGDQDTEGPRDAHSQYVKAWMGKVATESSVGRMVEEFLK